MNEWKGYIPPRLAWHLVGAFLAPSCVWRQATWPAPLTNIRPGIRWSAASSRRSGVHLEWSTPPPLSVSLLLSVFFQLLCTSSSSSFFSSPLYALAAARQHRDEDVDEPIYRTLNPKSRTDWSTRGGEGGGKKSSSREKKDVGKKIYMFGGR